MLYTWSSPNYENDAELCPCHLLYTLLSYLHISTQSVYKDNFSYMYAEAKEELPPRIIPAGLESVSDWYDNSLFHIQVVNSPKNSWINYQEVEELESALVTKALKRIKELWPLTIQMDPQDSLYL